MGGELHEAVAVRPAAAAPARPQSVPDLRIGAAGDPWEHEAKRNAARVTGGAPSHPERLQRPCACGGSPGPDGECAACRAKRLARRARPSAGGMQQAPAIVREARRFGGQEPASEGQRLPTAIVQRFAASTGALMARVRVHADTAGAAVARRHGAIALAYGTDLYFADRAFRPESRAGRELLTHELTHVVQQHRRSGPRTGAPAEAEADRAARSDTLPAVSYSELPHARPVIQRRTPAQQIATVLRTAVEGWGTDEDAIFSALTGRTSAEIADVEREYVALADGEKLEDRLRGELSDGDLTRAMALLRGGAQAVEPRALLPTRLAEQLRAAVEGAGTDEGTINAVLTGRSPDELAAIRAEYQRLYGESLDARLGEELSGGELLESSIAAQRGVLDPVDEIKAAVEGLGTDEERLFAVLTQVSTSRADVERTIDAYAAKGYGDMLADIRDDLSGAELERAMALLHAATPTASCTADERSTALEALSAAISLAQGAVARLDDDIARGRLSWKVETALAANFNPGGQAGAVNVGLAEAIRPVLVTARTDMLGLSQLRCGPHPTCRGDCTDFVGAFTFAYSGAEVHICPNFFTCRGDRPVWALHEFVHHTGLHDTGGAYRTQPGYAALTPPASLGNPDSFAHFARDVN